jgi:cell division protein FtsL
MMIDAPLLVWKLHSGQHSWSTHLRIHKAAREKFIKMMYVAKSQSHCQTTAD